MITQLIGVAVADMQHEVLRLAPKPTPVWLPRMSERPFSPGFSNALRFEALGWMRFTDGSWGFFDVGHIEDADPLDAVPSARSGGSSPLPTFA